MNGVGKVVGLKRGEQAALQGMHSADDEALLDAFIQETSEPQAETGFTIDEAPEQFSSHSGSLPVTLARYAIVAATLGWLGVAIYILVQRNFVLPSLESLPSAISTFATPAVMLGVAYLLLTRTGISEANRFAKITAALKNESEALDMRLAIVNHQLDAARQTMREQASLLENYGASASENMEATAGLLAHHVGNSSQHADSLLQSGGALSQKFSQIIDAMPDLEKKTAVISETLADGSQNLVDKIERLEARMEALVGLMDEARSRSLTATQSLTSQLSHMADATRGASEELAGMTDLSASRIGTAIDRVRQVVDETSLSLEARMADLNLLLDQSNTALNAIGSDAINRFGETIDSVETRLHELNRLIEGQSQFVAGIDTEIGNKIEGIGERFAAIESDGLESNQRLGAALAAIGEQAERLDGALKNGNDTAEALIARSETLLQALNINMRQLDETHPAVLDSLNDRIASSRNMLTSLTPEIEGLDTVATTLFERTREADELLRGQSHRLAQWLESSESALSSNHEQVRALEDALHAADEGARRLTDSSGPQLVAALLRIKDTAEQAADRARQALGRAITDSAAQLGSASEAALQNVLGDKISTRIEEVSAVSERAVKAAHAASDRLMRQLLTIADTSSSIEERIKDAEKQAEERSRDNFSRSSALLIEAMNSASIDIAKGLSTDVSDSSWAAYLKGDRGVFTRRAVRLLDNGDARSVASLYDSNDGFREQVNRYIHDFESMLRTILSTRDGSSLGVTMLSSDIGKLYVALAQAIDRLRG
jgi:ABC-type transporter Mla subunit MlaD